MTDTANTRLPTPTLRSAASVLADWISRRAFRQKIGPVGIRCWTQLINIGILSDEYDQSQTYEWYFGSLLALQVINVIILRLANARTQTTKTNGLFLKILPPQGTNNKNKRSLNKKLPPQGTNKKYGPFFFQKCFLRGNKQQIQSVFFFSKLLPPQGTHNKHKPSFFQNCCLRRAQTTKTNGL